MKCCFKIILVCFFPYFLLGQADSTNTPVIVRQTPKFKKKDVSYFAKYVQSKISYPEEIQQLGIEGRVFVQFVINYPDTLPEYKGVVDSVQVVKSLHPVLDSIAVSVIKSSPLWTSGVSRGAPENIWITIPVTFEIPELSRTDSLPKL